MSLENPAQSRSFYPKVKQRGQNVESKLTNYKDAEVDNEIEVLIDTVLMSDNPNIHQLDLGKTLASEAEKVPTKKKTTHHKSLTKIPENVTALDISDGSI